MARQTHQLELTSRIEDLAERLPAGSGPSICGGSDAECREKLEAMRAAGKPIGRASSLSSSIRSGENKTVIDDFRLQYLIDD